MLEKFSNLGTVLSKSEQKSIHGGIGDSCTLTGSLTYTGTYGTYTLATYDCVSSNGTHYTANVHTAVR